MSTSRLQKQSPTVQRLHPAAYVTIESRQHLQPMYTSVWLALYQGLMQSASSKPGNKL